jgi:hypothetical protein
MFMLGSLASAQVWTPPSQSFPSGQVNPPIHEGNAIQPKAGPNGSTSIFNFGGTNRASFQTDYFWSKFGQVSDGKVVAREFCLMSPSVLASPFNIKLTSSLNNCITSWPTGTTPPPPAADGLWQDLGTMLMPTDNRDVRVQGTSFSGTGDTASLFLGDGGHSLKAGWGFGLSLNTFGADNALVIRETTGNVGIGDTNPSAKLSIKGAGVNANALLVDEGSSWLTDNVVTSVWPGTQTNVGFSFSSAPAFLGDIKLNVWGNTYNDGKLYVRDETHLNRTVITTGNKLSGWDSDFEWGGGAGEFQIGTVAEFNDDVRVGFGENGEEADVFVNNLSHNAINPLQVCADNDGKLILCDSDHGSQVFTSCGAHTFTFPANAVINQVTVEVWGAGGGGSKGYGNTVDSPAATIAGRGGGAGGYVKGTFAGNPNQTYTVQVGCGGNGATANNQAGANGGTSQFGNGAGTLSLTSNGGRGATATHTNIPGNGQPGVGGGTSAIGVTGVTQQTGSTGGQHQGYPTGCGHDAGRIGGNGGHTYASFGVWATGGAGGQSCNHNGAGGQSGGVGGGGGGGQSAGEGSWTGGFDAGNGGRGGNGQVKITW